MKVFELYHPENNYIEVIKKCNRTNEKKMRPTKIVQEFREKINTITKKLAH
jgi:hypothetical protein